jgi:branched-chain amino acid transport system substrate-binding protein
MERHITRRTALSAFAATASIGIPGMARAADSALRIGRSLPLTGPFGEYGQQRVEGARLYFDQINRAGGIAGQRLEIPTLDDMYDGAKLNQNIARLDEEGVLAMFGSLGPGLAANLQEFPKRKLPLIAATSGFSLRNPPHTYIFPMRPGFAEETGSIVRHVATIGFRRIAIVRQEGPLGALGEAGYMGAMGNLKIKPVAVITLKTDGSNAQEAAQAFKATNCDCAVLSATAPAFARMARHYTAISKLPACFSVSAINTSQLLAELGDQAVGVGVCQVVPSPAHHKFPVAREYNAAAKEADSQPTIYGLEGFLEAKLLVVGLQRAARSGPLSRARVLHAFDTLGEVDLGGYRVSYAPGVRTGSSYVDMTFIAAGGRLRS